MTFYSKSSEKKRVLSEMRRRDEVVNSLCSMASRPTSPRSAQEQEKRLRREIANSNERRRMQSINAGFQFLRSLLPQGDEKLSKASILTQTAEYIYRLESEKALFLEQNCQLKRLVMSTTGADSDGDTPFAKKKRQDAGDLSDEGIGAPRMSSPPIFDNVEEMRREIQELTYALECEKKIRIHLEARLKHLESQNNSDKTFDAALQDHASYHITQTSRKHKSIDRLPKSLVHNTEAENFHEVPDSNVHIVPEDLSGRRSSPLEVSSSNVEASIHSPPSSFTVKLEVSSPNKTYAHSTSRQNLATIVEAIRHLEGDHMFRDDLPMSPISQSSSEELQTDQTGSPQDTDIDHILTLQHQIIKNAPVSQSRPGVIVSKLS